MIEDLKKDVLMKGLSEEQAAQSKKDFGTNELAKKEHPVKSPRSPHALLPRRYLDQGTVRRACAEDRFGGVRNDDPGAWRRE